MFENIKKGFGLTVGAIFGYALFRGAVVGVNKKTREERERQKEQTEVKEETKEQN